MDNIGNKCFPFFSTTMKLKVSSIFYEKAQTNFIQDKFDPGYAYPENLLTKFDYV